MAFLFDLPQKALAFVKELLRAELPYLLSYEDYVKKLKDDVEDLHDKRERVEHEVDDARRNGKEIPTYVDKWLNKVDEIVAEYDKYLKHEDHATTGCSNGVIANPWSRYHLGRRAYEMSQQVKGLVSKSNYDAVSYQLSPTCIDAVLSIIGYENFKSRNETTEAIMAALKDSTIRMIGIYGPGGVGKTTLVKEVARKARKDETFNVVVMADVTRNPNPKKIQGQIADMLGMRLEEESEIGRAGRLRERLRKEKENILVILDDLWEGLDLDKLGIPFDDNFSQRSGKDDDMMKKERSCGDYKMYKILLTSRSKEVLSNQMSVKENSIFSVGVLKKEEAEVLFKNVAGVPDKNSDFDALAAKIANKCGSLPMAIVTVARALRTKNYSNWNDALRQLESREFTDVHESMEFSTRLSYDHLESEELKSTFLLCARMGHHPLIMELMKFCIGLGIFQGVHTIKEARNKIDILVQKLKDSSLLLDSESNDRFNMHDTVRDAAMSIASKDGHVFTMRNCKLDEWPEKDELERYTAISLNYCDIIDGLPEGITCPRLKLFHLESSDPFLSIPDNFFEGMKTLRVLILTGIDLSRLPTSIEYLRNLRMLCLEQCVLGDNLSIIGKLKNLRILSLSGSKFKKLPNELRELGKLQLLDISNCSKVILIQPDVISRLNGLEELYMRNSTIQYEVEGQTNQTENDFVAELRNLRQLMTLDICIPNVAVLPQNLFLDKLDNYKIVIGDFKTLSVGDFKMPNKYEFSRTLALQLKEGNDIHYLKGIKLLFRKVEILLMGELNGVRNVFYELNLGGFQDLKHLSILNNIDIEYIINSMELSHPQDAFPNLESLYLYKLESIKQICCSDLTDASFGKLKTIKIMFCAQLKNLFSFYMVGLLKNVEEVEVSECDTLHEIVAEERQGNTDNVVKFPRLRSLVLQSLANFTSFYTKYEMHSLTQGPNMEVGEITVDYEYGVTPPLFSKEDMLPNLENLELSSIKICNIWSTDQSLPTPYFKNLMKLTVNDCNNLKHLLSLSMAAKLENLKGLFVSRCEMMEEIFIPEEISMNDGKDIKIFPKLEEIRLTCMEKLTTIWHAHVSLDSFGKLGYVVIEGCKKLVTVFPYHMMGRFQSLERVRIVKCESVEEIFDLEDAPKMDGGKETNLRFVILLALPKLKHVWSGDPEGILILKNLRRILVNKCPVLKNLLPASVAKDLEKLEYLSVMNCIEMEEIVMLEEGSETCSIAFVFAQVTYLVFAKLPQLKSFYRGRHTIEWPTLKQLVVIQCDKLEAFATRPTNPEEQPIFLPEEAISNLEGMEIGMKEAERLQQCIGNYRIMHRLKKLCLLSVQRIEILFWFLHRFLNLEILILSECFFKELFQDGSLPAQERIGTVVQLKGLILRTFPSLHNIGFEHDPVIQRVERLFLYQCPRLVNLAPSSVSFTHLTDLKIFKCDGLINLMASSTAKSLVQLTVMKVIQCKVMLEIVAEESVEEKDEIVFSKLTTLELKSLQVFTSFCSSKILAFKFPLLEKLIVQDCPKMKMFCGGVTTTPTLRQVHVIEGEEEGKWFWEGDLNATIQKISAEMVSFKYFQALKLSDYPELEQVWHGKISLPDNCFRNLKTLVVENCDHLSFSIPSILLADLKNLEELQVRSCSLVEAIFDIDDTKVRKTERIAFGMKTLTLDELPNLKHVWNKNPQGFLCFENLQEVNVTRCEGLQTMFPASVAKNLLKLETLSIEKCGSLMEIITKEEAAAEGATNEFVFPRLASFTLSLLPELKCFYPGSFNLECPLLKKLRLFHCGKLKIFTSESPGHEEAHSEGHAHADSSFNGQNSLFPVQKVIPLLEEMSINEKDMLKHGEFDKLLNKLKYIVLQCFHNVIEADTLCNGFLSIHKVPSIETLVVACSGFKEIFSPQGPDVDYIGIFAQLRQLKLSALCKLSTIGLEHSWLDLLRRNLETLDVDLCPRLTKLVQSAVSLSKLKQLVIARCHGLVYLFTSSTAKSLVQLESLDISECKSIKEIVAKEGEESILDEIIFVQLRSLFLISLSSLVCFYKGNSPFRFPTLGKVVIEQCPRMKAFSQGVINSPMLRAVQVSLETRDFCWEGDLNTTADKLFKEKGSFEHSQHLNLSNFPDLEQIWLGEVLLSQNCFCNLKTLVVENCEFISNVIPSNLLPYLKNLEELKVGNCSSVEAIFDANCMKMTKAQGKVFRLKRLTLDYLPNLRHVWNKNCHWILNFKSLQKVKVTDCEGLKTLFPAADVAKDLLKLESLEIQNCGALVEIVGKDETDAEGKIDKFVFCCLTSLTLNLLPELKCFYPGKFNLECPMLRVLNVYHCGKLEILTSETQSYQEALSEDQVGVSVDTQPLFSVQKVTPNLEELSLSEKETMMLWHGEYPTNLLHKLKCLQFHCFHEIIEDKVLPYGFLHKVPNVESLAVACSDFKEIFPSQKLEVENIKILAQLRRLRLEFLSKLNSIGLEHSWLDPLRENLGVLEVRGCPCLTKLVKSSVSLSNLEELLINECHGLVHLFTSSSAKSLVQLRKMSIEKCESLQEIVAKEGDEVPRDNVTFERLRELSLNSLSSLVSFYTGSFTLNLPSLEDVIIMQCPKMEIFSQGPLNAPKLPNIQTSLDENDLYWEGDLNSTVQKLYQEKVKRRMTTTTVDEEQS